MTPEEKQMLDLMIRGRNEHGILSVKAEFEAEGTRADELLRLLDIARRAGVKVGIKIGGCEAIRDLIECRQYGADYIIAPMVETPYALKKYIAAKNKCYSPKEQEDVSFLFNVETLSTTSYLDELGQIAQQGNVGMVFGRVDFAGSMGKDRSIINTPQMGAHVAKVAEVTKMRDLELVVGGGVSPEGIEALRDIRKTRLDRFETRKVIFDAAILDGPNAADAMEIAIEFELLWLQNKRNYYQAIASEDATRIEMMELRQAGKSKLAA